MPYVLKSEVFIRGKSPGEDGGGGAGGGGGGGGGGELGPLFLNFQDPPLAST